LSLQDKRRLEEENILFPYIEKAFETEKPHLSSEIFYKDKNNIMKVLLVTTSKIQDEDGKTQALVATLRDITKEKEVDRMKEEILSNVSHELRTPLTSIHNSIYLLVNKVPGYINKDQEKLLSIIKRNAERLMGIINNLLDLSKIEAGVLELKIELISIKNILEESFLQVKTLAQAKKLKVNIKSDRLPKIYASKEGVEHILINLISNAIKFTPTEGSISIQAKNYNKHYILFFVADTGVGIPKEEIERIFDKFHQLENPLSPKTEGTGVGLTIAKYFVEAHKGKIWVESEVGKGSKFNFILPKLNKYIENTIEEYIKDAKACNMPFSVCYLKLKKIKNMNFEQLEAEIKANIHQQDKVIRNEKKKYIFLILKDANKTDAELVLKRLSSFLENKVENFSILVYPTDFKNYPQLKAKLDL
jgi:signal transduction histidine kinase